MYSKPLLHFDAKASVTNALKKERTIHRKVISLIIAQNNCHKGTHRDDRKLHHYVTSDSDIGTINESTAQCTLLGSIKETIQKKTLLTCTFKSIEIKNHMNISTAPLK